MKYSVLLLLMIVACSVPIKQIATPRNFPYPNYDALCDTVWESENKEVCIKFNSQVKSAILLYKKQQYDFVSYECHEGVFTMGIAKKRGKESWNILVLHPEAKTRAYYDLIGDKKKIGGTLNQINKK